MQCHPSAKSHSALVKDSFDFIVLNHYETLTVSDDSQRSMEGLRDYVEDMFAAICLDFTLTLSFQLEYRPTGG
ncbi:hypothetical protein EJ110_NYTH51611 [Nymphaea thermarum]|nr:hypothetical protein EJ110_NYTH51611 [Nymphaea thermarum]